MLRVLRSRRQLHHSLLFRQLIYYSCFHNRLASNMKEEEGKPAPTRNRSKRRWSREEKALHRERKASQQHVQTKKMPQELKKPKKVQLSPNERLLQCAEDALHTGSVRVQQIQSDSDSTSSDNGSQQLDATSIHIQTYYQREPSSTMLPHSTSHIVSVQPLLILDLNGILCHRIRHTKHSPKNHRPSTAHVANTPIIPRVDLQDFLQYLDANFCLAVWTSAKIKTAKQLVSLLFPDNVQKRLLFVWAQSKCHAIPRDNRSDKKPLFQKPLSRVWQEFPLWNADNTFMVDDSPKKCGMEFSFNTLHPPPLHGYHHFPLFSSHNTVNDKSMPDLENEERQLQFFQRLVETIDNEKGNMHAFLETHGRGHMGWRGPSETGNDNNLES